MWRGGEFLSIVGPSGSGKSTLFHVVGGLTPATGGSVRIGGQDISSLSDAERTGLRKNKVGFVFQKFNLLPTLTARRQHRHRARHRGSGRRPEPEFENVLKLLGISGRLEHKPSAFSGGEQQRVAHCARRGQSSGDSAGRRAHRQPGYREFRGRAGVLRDLNRRLGQTILMITHNPEAAAFGHRIVRMRDGRIVS